MAVGLILPEVASFCEISVCGLPLLTRAVCTFGRTADVDTVYILQTPAVADGYAQELETALAARRFRPQVVWLQHVRAVPPEQALFIVAQPGVFDHRLCAAIEALPGADAGVVRCRQAGEPDGLLWYVGKQSARAFVAAADAEASITEWLGRQRTDDFDAGDTLCLRVSDTGSLRAAERQLYAATRKTTDTWIARNFDRHISAWITSWLLPRSVTPTQVTYVAFGLGVLGAVLIALGSYLGSVIGSALLVLSIIVDGCDGEIARLKFLETPSGRQLDFVLDNVVNALTLFTVGIGRYFRTGSQFFLYAPAANALAALASTVPVYLLYYQHESQPAGTDTGPKSLGERITEAVAGRDFMYLIFVLALFGRVHWFVYLTLGGIGFFLASVLVILISRRLGLRPPRRESAASRQADAPPVPVATADPTPKG
jgi:phosphatidylglycerophosphate synthase